MGDENRAITDYTRAIELDPRNVLAYNNRGNAYLPLGKLEEAIRDYNRAIEIDPGTAAIYLNRGFAMLLKGNRWRLRSVSEAGRGYKGTVREKN